MKTYKYEQAGMDQKLSLSKGKYATGNLAITMESWINGYPEPWSTLTVNLPESSKDYNKAFIDINGNGQEIYDFLIENNIATPTGIVAYSGFCVYPEFEFSDSFMKN